MITIDLRPGRKSAPSGSPLAPLTDRLKQLGASVRNPALAGAFAVLAVVAGGLVWLYASTGATLAELEPKLETTRAEHRRFQAFLADKKKQQVLRDSLAAQIGTIRSVDGDRYVWSHVLDEVARALPENTWLTDLSAAAPAAPVDSLAADSTAPPPPPAFVITGRTLDIQAYTKFLRDLEASPWLVDVTPIQANTLVENDRPVTAFSVRASFAVADSAYIRTVPLSQSVR